MKTKTIQLTLIILIMSVYSQPYTSDPPRDFIRAFLSNVLHREITLDDRCFGSNFDKDLENLKKYADLEDEGMTFIVIEKIIIDYVRFCPSDLVALVGKDVYNLIVKMIKEQSIDLLNIENATKIILHEYKKEQHTGTSIGEMMGKVIATLLIIN